MDPITSLFENGAQTRDQLGLSYFKVNRMVDKGEIVRSKDTQKVIREGKPSRGRPAYIYRLSDRTRKRVKRAQKA